MAATTRSNRHLGAFALLMAACAIALAGRAAWCAPPPGSSSAADPRFRAMVARFIDSEMRLSPERATGAGDHRFDDKLSDLSPSGIRARIRHAHDWKARFSFWKAAL